MAVSSQQKTIALPAATAPDDSGRALWRNTAIALMALLTLVDLFATQAILPSLAAHYKVGAAAMGLAVNASTFGMAAGALAMALVGARIDRRRGVSIALALLAVPTLLLAYAPDLATFSALRIVQGLAMSAAFALALSYLSEHCSKTAAAGAFAGVFFCEFGGSVQHVMDSTQNASESFTGLRKPKLTRCARSSIG